MLNTYKQLLLIALFFFSCSNAANILGIWFHAGKSHHILGEMLFKELATRGHNVTMASPFPLKKPFPNYTDIHLTGIMEDQLSRIDMFMKMNTGHNLIGVPDVVELTRAQTELTLNHTEMKKLINSNPKFDVIIIDWFMNSAILVYGKIFNAPIIPIASHGTTVLASYAVGNPTTPSYIANAMFSFPYNMTFFQRVANSLISVLYQVVGNNNVEYHMSLVQKYYGDCTYEDLKSHIAVILSNGHYSYEYPRPIVPNLIPVGGFHVQKPSKLPQDLQEFMDGAKNGVIYFSLGSNMQSVLLPEEKQGMFMDVFKDMPEYRILWKWEGKSLPDKPDHVKISKWLPQNDILGHPNTKLFISHGGLLSTIEAIHHGVPVLGIPVFGDQKNNVLTAVSNGYALYLDLNEIDKTKFKTAVTELLLNKTYKENVQRRSKLLKDQPLSPMDTAVFWVEHVIRHKGAPHLVNAGVYQSWYQYLLLDVICFLLAVLTLLIVFIYFIMKFTFKLISRKVCKCNKKTKLS